MASELFGSEVGCAIAANGARMAIKYGYDVVSGTTYEGCSEDFVRQIKGASEYHDYGLPLALAVLRRREGGKPYEALWQRHLDVATGKWTDRGAL